MRFDDTNPAKENTEFENIILEDVKLLNIDYDIFSFTSNHFPAMLEYAEEMIKKVLISSQTLRHLFFFLRAIAIMIKCNGKEIQIQNFIEKWSNLHIFHFPGSSIR